MRWFMNRGGQNEGPLEEAALVEAIRRGEVPPTTQICAEGGPAWQPLLTHPAFAEASAQAAAAAAPPSGIAATMAMTSVDPASMPGMLGSLSGADGAAGAPTPTPAPAVPAAMTPAPGSAPGVSPQVAPSPVMPPPGAPVHPGTPAPPMGAPAAQGNPSPFTPAPFTPAPSAPAGEAAPKSRVPLLVGGGCALLLVGSLCLGGGVFAYFQLQGDPFADRTHNLGDIVTRVAVDGRHDDASDWACVSGEDLMSSPGETRARMADLGGHPEVVLTAVELVATQGSYNVRGLALVFPDGRVRYSSVRSQPIYDFMEQPHGWSTGRERDEDMLEGVTQLLEALAAEDCDIEWVSADDLEGLPTELVGEIMENVAIPPMREACNVVATAEDWERSVGGISVIVQGNDRTAILNTALGQAPGTSVCMGPIRARVYEAEPAEGGGG